MCQIWAIFSKATKANIYRNQVKQIGQYCHAKPIMSNLNLHLQYFIDRHCWPAVHGL